MLRRLARQGTPRWSAPQDRVCRIRRRVLELGADDQRHAQPNGDEYCDQLDLREADESELESRAAPEQSDPTASQTQTGDYTSDSKTSATSSFR